MNAPISTTNASRAGGIDMSLEDSSMNMPPQTPAGMSKVPSLDMSKVGPGNQPPQSTTNKNSGRLLLQSPSAAQARNALAERALGGKEKQTD